VKCQVLTAAVMYVTVFWLVTPCSLVEIDQRFRGTYCLYHQNSSPVSTRLHGAVIQKTVILKSKFFSRVELMP
jgi:hypothetical protein